VCGITGKFGFTGRIATITVMVMVFITLRCFLNARSKNFFCCWFCSKGVAKKFLFPFLPQFVMVFTAALQQPDGPTSDSGLKMEILKVLTAKFRPFLMLLYQWILYLFCV